MLVTAIENSGIIKLQAADCVSASPNKLLRNVDCLRTGQLSFTIANPARCDSHNANPLSLFSPRVLMMASMCNSPSCAKYICSEISESVIVSIVCCSDVFLSLNFNLTATLVAILTSNQLPYTIASCRLTLVLCNMAASAFSNLSKVFGAY